MINTYFTMISIIVASDNVKKIIGIMTLKLYLQIKANITSQLTALNLLTAEVLFTLNDTIDKYTSSP